MICPNCKRMLAYDAQRCHCGWVKPVKPVIEIPSNYEELKNNMILTTTDEINGFRITSYLDVVYGECAFTESIFTTLFGGSPTPDEASQNLEKARIKSQALMIHNAAMLSADAVVGMNVNIVLGGHNMMIIQVIGTAVKLEKI